jgi:Nucleotidyl transferase AbiEii toxin, Type IV TA system
MDELKSYKTAGAFRTALETRLQTRAREEVTDLQRLRRQVAFDRFLARMFSKGPEATYPWVLKGGYAMELRVHSARTTKDLDLTLHDGTRFLGSGGMCYGLVLAPSCKGFIPTKIMWNWKEFLSIWSWNVMIQAS